VEGATVDLDGTAVGSGYFATMGIPMIEGRDFSAADEGSPEAVAIVNQTMARRFWPDGGAIGRDFIAGRKRYTIIGVVRDSRHRDLRSLLGQGGPFIYVNAGQSYMPRMTLLVRTATPPASIAAVLNREARAANPDAPPLAVRTAREHVNEVFAQERAAALLTGILGLIGLLLATAGIYAVVGYQVEERTREIGVRMALGAQPRQALWLMLRRTAALAGAGVAIGLAISLAGGKVLSGMLFGVSPSDARTFLSAAALLIAVALGASWIPARRAARVDPAITLRYE
jgi:predicted permease